MRKSIIAAAAFGLMSTTAFAADYAEPAPEVFSWTGFYIGAWAAYNDVNRTNTLSTPTSTVSIELEDSFSGFSGGALLGFNYQFDSLVVGLEGDIGISDINDTETLSIFQDDIDTTYGIRARLGYAVDHTLLFIEGGVAWADYEFSLNSPTGGTSIDLFDKTLFGWQIGGGVEQAVTDNITIRLEYLYTDYDDKDDEFTTGGTTVTTEADLDSHTIRLGVNFLFGGL
jgi:outer membrane immunogenic protein